MTHIFTFGFGQGHDNGYVIIHADTWQEARKKMVKEYGLNWGFQYVSEEEAGVDKYHLHLVKEIE